MTEIQTNMIMKTADPIDGIDTVSKTKHIKQETTYKWHIYKSKEDYAAANNLPHSTLHNIIFFDMDNTLYPASSGVSAVMRDRIKLFLVQHLSFPEGEAGEVGNRFYNDYGLAIKGCVKHFGVDPRLYDGFVDGGLPLEQLVGPMEGSELEVVKGARGRRWVFTNAGRLHTERVLTMLGITELFEGVVHCDYTEPDFPAKPDRRAFERAIASVTDTNTDDKVYFVDDSGRNVEAGRLFGWRSVCLDELGEHGRMGCPVIKSLTELPSVFPELYDDDKVA